MVAALVQTLTLLTSSTARWTTTQEKAIARDYPFTDIHLETPDQFVLRTYLQFLWLPESIMPIHLLVPSLHRVQHASPPPPNAPHPLHAHLDPVLLSVRSVTTKYHTDMPYILAQDGGEGDPEESMMWYALSYEMNELGDVGTNINNEDAVLLEEKARRVWLERLERREVQIQILLYLLKLSLPGPCTPLPRVKIPANDAAFSAKKKPPRERVKFIVPSPRERLESFMDKLSMWQLVSNMNDSNINTPGNRDGRDWMQTFCESVVERQFKLVLPDMCTLLRQKLFPHSPFSDEDTDTDTRSNSGSHIPGSSHPHHSRKLARSSTSASISRPKGKSNPKPIRRSPSIPANPTSDTRSRSRSLSVSLAQDASARRANSTCGTSSSLKRALSREVSMSRGFKPRAQPSQSSQLNASTKVSAKQKKDTRKPDQGSQGVTLVAATPVKPKATGGVRNHRPAASPSRGRSCSDTSMGDEDGFCDELGDIGEDGLPQVRDEDEELWLPDSSPDVFLLGTRKRAASGSSSSRGLSDPADGGGMDTPVKKRFRV